MGWTSQYILENEAGERYDLTPPAPVFMVNVQGLGVAVNDDFGDLGDGFFFLTQKQDPQNGITGDLIYQDGAFGNFQTLVNWIHRAKTLYFCYTPIDTEYRRRVRLRTMQKSRRDGSGYMRAQISIEPLTPWYLPSPTDVTVTTTGADDKGYFEHSGDYYYEYDDDLQYGGDTAGDMTAQISAQGHIPAAFVLRYMGALTNPEIRLAGANSGTVYGICKLTYTTGASDTLELSTLYDDSHIHKISSGGVVTDLLQYVDLNYEIYPHAAITEPTLLSITSGTAMTGTAELAVYYFYRSV